MFLCSVYPFLVRASTRTHSSYSQLLFCMHGFLSGSSFAYPILSLIVDAHSWLRLSCTYVKVLRICNNMLAPAIFYVTNLVEVSGFTGVGMGCSPLFMQVVHKDVAQNCKALKYARAGFEAC